MRLLFELPEYQTAQSFSLNFEGLRKMQLSLKIRRWLYRSQVVQNCIDIIAIEDVPTC